MQAHSKLIAINRRSRNFGVELAGASGRGVLCLRFFIGKLTSKINNMDELITCNPSPRSQINLSKPVTRF